jgi:hypothetical protein
MFNHRNRACSQGRHTGKCSDIDEEPSVSRSSLFRFSREEAATTLHPEPVGVGAGRGSGPKEENQKGTGTNTSMLFQYIPEEL